MIPPSMELVERLLGEDVSSVDLTTHLLDLPVVPARIRFTARSPITVAGTALVQALCERVGAQVESSQLSGTLAGPGSVLLQATATPAELHRVWKVAVNVYEAACGIATRTRELVEAARSAAPDIEVVTTRKVIPGTKDLAISAILAGGALPHRLGLSETVLVFDQHAVFIGGVEGVARRLQQVRRRTVEKLVFVEVASLADAQLLAAAGADGLQFDKVPAEELASIVAQLRVQYPALRIIAAGGINAGNAAAYAATGVDALASSWMYAGPPADIGVVIAPC